MTQDKFRFDTGSVYMYSAGHSGYLFLCSFFQAGIRAKNRESTKIKLAEKWLEDRL